MKPKVITQSRVSIYFAAFFYTGFVIILFPSLLVWKINPEAFRIVDLVFLMCLAVGLYCIARLFYNMSDTIYVVSEFGITRVLHGKVKTELPWDEIAYIYMRSNCNYPSQEGFILAKARIENPFKTRWIRRLEKAEPNCVGWFSYSKQAEDALREYAPDKIVDLSPKCGPVY